MTIGRIDLPKSETVTVAAIEGGVPLLVEAREIMASVANGVVKDRAAVGAAITSPWSNGQTEGQTNKLKLVKRQMYGRGKIDLL
jgi:transposase